MDEISQDYIPGSYRCRKDVGVSGAAGEIIPVLVSPSVTIVTRLQMQFSMRDKAKPSCLHEGLGVEDL